MSAFQLTRQEAWVLATLLKLPIQQGSALGEWLGNKDTPTSEEIASWIPQTLEILDQKGYSPTKNAKKSISLDLMESIMLAAVGQKHIFTTLRTNMEGVSTRFLLAGSGIVQYGYEKDHLILHSPQQFEEMLPSLLPDWLNIAPSEREEITMPQSAFLLFKQACLQRDISFLLNANGSETFLRTDLEKSFATGNGWIDVFHALGINGIEPLDTISVPTQLEYLLSIDYLKKVDPSQLQIGAAGAALAKSLSDPDQVTITIGFNRLQLEKSCTSVFLIGWKRLYQLDFIGESISITCLRSRLEGLDRIRSLIVGQKF